MFFPPGRPVHENLATSYVLVDALLEDLCEGGFSGVVEVVLRNSDCHIVVYRGQVVTAVEQHGAAEPAETTVSEIASRSRKERGRVSVVSYSLETAEMVAARISAEPLYSRLTTEFADPARMIDKLRREPNREWFVEMRIGNGGAALVSLKEDRCLVVTSRYPEAPADAELALNKLIEDCKRFGGSFDVFFRVHQVRQEVREAEPEVEETPRAEAEQLIAAAATANSAGAVDIAGLGASETPIDASPDQPPAKTTEEEGIGRLAEALETHDLADALIVSPAESEVAETLAEAKRLMGEVVRTIENATGAGDPRDSFSLNLRAAQLKVADRYPFLDPFGSEFEYYAGEIAFVGTTAPNDFVEGLTEALRLAVASMVETSSQPARLKNRIETVLQRLFEGQREEFESYGLDKSIERIYGSKVSEEAAGET